MSENSKNGCSNFPKPKVASSDSLIQFSIIYVKENSKSRHLTTRLELKLKIFGWSLNGEIEYLFEDATTNHEAFSPQRHSWCCTLFFIRKVTKEVEEWKKFIPAHTPVTSLRKVGVIVCFRKLKNLSDAVCLKHTEYTLTLHCYRAGQWNQMSSECVNVCSQRGDSFKDRSVLLPPWRQQIDR